MYFFASAMVFLRALGLRGADEIIRTFYQVDRINLRDNVLYWSVGEGLVGQRSRKDVKVGDVLLKEVAKRLLSKMRETDTIARLGGDEFTIFTQNIGLAP